MPLNHYKKSRSFWMKILMCAPLKRFNYYGFQIGAISFISIYIWFVFFIIGEYVLVNRRWDWLNLWRLLGHSIDKFSWLLIDEADHFLSLCFTMFCSADDIGESGIRAYHVDDSIFDITECGFVYRSFWGDWILGYDILQWSPYIIGIAHWNDSLLQLNT